MSATNGTANKPMIESALEMARRGWRIFPLHTPTTIGCSCGKTCGRRRGKHPRTAHGPKDATADERTIRHWWTKWPDANIGVATGPESGIIVMDFDGEGELPLALQNLPRTVTVKTGRGSHRYFRYTEGVTIGNRAKINDLPIDLRGVGGYVIAPPSLHASGVRYAWEIGPADSNLADAPPALVAWLTAPKRIDPPPNGTRTSHHQSNRTNWMRRARAYLAKIPPAVEGENGSAQLMRALRLIHDRFDLDAHEFRQIAGEYSDTCTPPWSEREIEHAIENINKEPSKRFWEHAARHKRTTRQPNNDGSTIVDVIRDYLRATYDPTFRRGANIWAQLLGREVSRAEACAAPTSEIIPALLAATDFPRGEAGPKRSAVPSTYRQWAPLAWADLLASLEDEADSPEIAETAAEQFRTSVADALMSIETFGIRPRDGKEGAEVQRRSLIDWCRLFAKAGPWQNVRSLALWCRLDEEGHLQVAVHQRLFAQIRRGNLGPSTHRRFVALAELYGVGTGGRTSRARFVELAPDFIADLLIGPCDGRCDDNGDAAHTRARAKGASHAPSHGPSHTYGVDDAIEDPPMTPHTEGR